MLVMAFGFLMFLVAAFAADMIDSPQTKLFRQIWLMERLSGGSARMRRKQAIAFDALLSGYELDRLNPKPGIHFHIASLLSAAEAFDVNNRNHLGIKLVSVFTRELRNRDLLKHATKSKYNDDPPTSLCGLSGQIGPDFRTRDDRGGQVAA